MMRKNLYRQTTIIMISAILMTSAVFACSGGKDTTVQSSSKPASTATDGTNSPFPTVTTAMDVRKIDLSIGQQWEYEYFIGDVAIGTDEGRIMMVSQDAGSIKYKIASRLKLGNNPKWVDLDSHAYLRVDEFLVPSAYNAVEAIGCSSCQSTQLLVECNIKNNIASTSIWNNTDNTTDKEETVLEPATFLLSEKAVTWLAMMYRILPLEKGGSKTIPVYYPDSFEATKMELSVRPNTEVIDTGDNKYEVFVCDVKSPVQTHYVSLEGQLLKVVFPEDDIVIHLASG